MKGHAQNGFNSRTHQNGTPEQRAKVREVIEKNRPNPADYPAESSPAKKAKGKKQPTAE